LDYIELATVQVQMLKTTLVY